MRISIYEWRERDDHKFTWSASRDVYKFSWLYLKALQIKYRQNRRDWVSF